MPGNLSESVQALLREGVTSYEALEALLLLARENERSFTDEEVAEALQVRFDGISNALETLAAVEGLLSVSTQAGQRQFRYSPASEELRQSVEELALAYVDQRLQVVQVMSANALDRVRGAAMLRLANAFRFERPKK